MPQDKTMSAEQAAKQEATDTVAVARDMLIQFSHDIHARPELAWNEVYAAELLAQHLDDLGFTVQRQAFDLPTSVLGTTGDGDFNITVCAEYDALPGIGHACGHNIIAAIALGVAAALKPLTERLNITLNVLGTPAEEGGGGKIILLDRGAFRETHLALMAHPGPVDVAHAIPYAVKHARIRYDGKASHAAAYPELGVNSADAFTIAQVSIGLMRQQLRSTTRIHGVVTNAGNAPNIIPERTEGKWSIRASTIKELEPLYETICNCFKAGAVATGCEVDIQSNPPYSEFANDDEVLRCYIENAEKLGRRFEPQSPAARMNRASTDMGNVSQVVPAIHPYIGLGSFPVVNHQAEFAKFAVSPAGDKAVLDGAMGLAHTIIDAALRQHIRQRLTARRTPDEAHRSHVTVSAS